MTRLDIMHVEAYHFSQWHHSPWFLPWGRGAWSAPFFMPKDYFSLVVARCPFRDDALDLGLQFFPGEGAANRHRERILLNADEFHPAQIIKIALHSGAENEEPVSGHAAALVPDMVIPRARVVGKRLDRDPVVICDAHDSSLSG